MAERAHPEDPGFKDHWIWQRRFKGLIPLPKKVRSQWKEGLISRYKFCQTYASGKRVLDIPCGVGWGTSLLQRTKRLVGVDLNREAIKYAKSHYGYKADFMVGDMRQLPFSINEFDLVICLEGIEHVPMEIGKKFIQESARILSDCGKIVLTNPLPDPVRPPNPYHIHEYDLEELEVFLKPYFEKQLQEILKIGGVSIVYYVGKLKNKSN